jgi:hypothetical protein
MATDLELEIAAFFDRYNEAWAIKDDGTIDGNRIASLYSAPTMTMRGDGSIHCLQPREELAPFFQGVADTYQRAGVGSSTLHDFEVVPIDERSALATMTWKQLRADGSLLKQWRQSYNVVRHEEGWQILVSTFHLTAPEH